MPALHLSIDQAALDRLTRASARLNRTVDDLAECAVEEAALDWERNNPDPLVQRQGPPDFFPGGMA